MYVKKLFICIFMAILMLLNIPLVDTMAGEWDIEKTVTIKAGNTVTSLKYNGRNVLGTSAWYTDAEGNTMPAYCIDPLAKGVGEISAKQYDVNIAGANMDPAIAGVILSGYPYKTPSELGVANTEEAYAATKAAIWSVLSNSPYNDISKWEAVNQNVLNAMHQIIADSKQYTHIDLALYGILTKTQPTITNNNVQQVFGIGSNYPVLEYKAEIDGAAPSGTTITDESGAVRSIFLEHENYVVNIPVSSITGNGNVQVKITAKIKSNVILYGDPIGITGVQRYEVPMIPQLMEMKSNTPYTKIDPPEDPEPEQPGKIRIKKLKEGTTQGLAGAEFMVTDHTGGILGYFYTDSNGEVIVQVNQNGPHGVTEITPPSGFQLSDINHKDVIVNEDRETLVTFSNKPTSDLILEKVDADDARPLYGARIRVSLDGGHQSWDVTTGMDGRATLTGLPDGTYSVQEIISPMGYSLNSEKQIIKIVSGEPTQTITIKNHKEPGIIITKYDEDTGLVLPGAEFSIAELGGSIVHEGITGHDGRLIVTGLKGNQWYRITELAAPSGYLIRDESKDVFLEDGKQVNIKFDNRRRPAIEILKLDEETHEPLAGAVIKVKETESSTVSTYTTGPDGRILIENLDEAIYTIWEEVPPNGYYLKEQRLNIKTEWGKTKTIIITNTRLPSLEILKVDEETKEPLPNAKFRITHTEGSTVKEELTDAEGKIILTDLAPGIYSVDEISPPYGYLLESQHIDIELKAGDNKQLIITNKAKPRLRIQKVDARTGELLKNAEFRVEKVQDKTLSEYILENGEITLENLDEAIYRVTEFMPPDGYIALTESKEIFTEWGLTKTLKFDNVRKPVIVFRKTNALTGKGIAGATFRVEYETAGGGTKNLGNYRTDTTGRIILPKAEVGWYVFTEVLPAPGFSMPSNPVTRQYFAAGDNAYLEEFDEYYTAGTGKFASGSTDGGNSSGTESDKSSSDSSDVQTGGSGISNAGSGNHGTAFGEITVYSGSDFYVEGEGFNWPLNSIVIKKSDANTGELLDGAVFELYRADEQVSGQPGTLVGTYTTDHSGIIVVVGLEPGYYVVKESNAPTNYIIAETSLQNGFLKPDGTTILEFSFRNYPYGSILISKIDGVTGEPLANARFKVTDSTGAVVGNSSGEFTTNSLGEILIENVPPGSYVLTEIQAPDNYAINTTPRTVQVGTDGKISKEIFDNFPFGSILISKIDGMTGEPLANARFKVTDNSGKVVGSSSGEFITNSQGEILIENVAPGSYVLTEIQAPEHYAINTTPKTIVVGIDGKTVKASFDNYAFGTLVINKLDADTKEPLAGAQFKVTTSKGDVVGGGNGLYTTTESGSITIPNLPKGSYVVTEVKAPANYITENQTTVIEIEYATTHSIDIYNRKMSSVQIVKIDGQTKQPLKGAEFTVYKANGEVVGTYTTDGDGLVIISNLDPGWYKAVETKVPFGYIKEETPIDFEMTSNQFLQLTIENQPMSSLIIKKFDKSTKEPLIGARFKITKKSGEVIGEYVSDANGLIQLDRLEPGWYSAVEVAPPTGYLLSEQAQDFEITHTKTVTLEFPNEKLTSLIIKKLDESSGAPLAGASFLVERQNGQHIGEFTTGSDGLITIPGLTPGYYVIQEQTAPIGYLLDESTKVVEVKTEVPSVATFTNKKLASLQIKKIDKVTGAPLAGVEFTVERQNGERIGDTYVTDAQGFINIPTLDPGYYIVREIKTASGYILDQTPKTVQVKTDSPTIVTFANAPMSGLKIIKLDSSNRQPIRGVEFTIAKMNGEKITNNFGGYTFTTDSSGQIYISNLEDGYYTVTETKTANGYFLDSEPKTVQITSDGNPTVLEVLNDPASGLLIVKTDAVTGDPLQGVVFDIQKADGQFVSSSILDRNQPNTPNNSPNKTTSPNGDISGSYTTDANGRIRINTLEPGEYMVTERQALPGYELDTNVYTVTVTAGRQATLRLTNTPMAGLRIHKIDAITKEGIYGVEFRVYDATTGKEIGGPYTSDDRGYVDFTGILPEGRYKIVETRQADGYMKDDVPKTIDFRAGKTTEVIWENTPILGQLQITKKSADDNPINGFPAGTLLEGAVFEIYNRAGNKVDTIKTDKNGWAASQPLPLGRYTIREVQAPAYYSARNEVIDTEIEFSGQIVRLEVLNSSTYTNVSIQKRGYTEVTPGQSIRYDFKQIGNNSTVALDSFYWRDTLPTDAVRLDKIITGTWTQRLSYKIVYKTNLDSDYKTMYDNLSTSQIYTLDASPAALGLASNEYVTEFMFVFGRVPAGFKQVEAPYIYCNVLPNMPHEYRFTNKCDVGGLWGSQWIMSNDRWVSIIYNGAPAKLPRTGY